MSKIQKAFDIKKYEKKGVSTSDIKEIKEAFDLLDYDKSGDVDTKELKEALAFIGLAPSTLNNLMESLDSDGNNLISFDEFFSLLTTQASVGHSEADIQRVFELFTGNKTGYIDLDNLKEVSDQLYELNMTDAEITEMFRRADKNGDGKVTVKEFFSSMAK